MIVRRMTAEDISKVALIHAKAFSRQKLSKEWVSASLNAYPKSHCCVLVEDDIIGYIIWTLKSAFRAESVVELEQIAIVPDCQKQGLGRRLIEQSLAMLKVELWSMDSCLKHIVVSTRADNHAQKLYRDVLGAKIEATMTNLYSADEVLMVARHIA